MSDDDTGTTENTDGFEVDRRTFVRAGGVAAGAGLLGVGASGSAAARDGFHRAFANPRAYELSRVWEQGYRGRPDRTVVVGDTGADGRHPDLAWNDVRIVENGDDIGLQRVEVGEGGDEPVGKLNDGKGYSGTLGPGVADAGQTRRKTHALDVPDDADEVSVTATWSPQRQDNELLLLDENGNQKASSTDFNPLSGEGESLTAPVEPGYKVAIETYASVASEYEITGTFIESATTFEPLPDGFDPLPSSVDASTPKLVGWKGGTLARDGNGHGSHTSSITAGSGAGSAVDEATVVEEAPRAVLLPGDFRSYEVDPVSGKADPADEGGVYGAVYGENLVVEIEAPDGTVADETTVTADSGASGDVSLAETHAAQDGTYTVYVKPSETTEGAVSRVERVSVGALLPPSETAGDRTGEDPSLHAGAAPNASLVTIQGLTNALTSLSEHAAFFTSTFGARTANFSYGGLQTERLGLSDTYIFVKRMAEGGILTVSSAGNFGPLTGSTGPSGADEAIAVAATGPMDGLTAYTSGGTAVRGRGDGNDGPAGETYRKPDVTAPGGTLDDLVNAVRAGDPDGEGPVRGYTGKAGTSMAAPYTNGSAGLVANAMEFDAPDGIALPEPSETGYEDVLRLKQVMLATATETVFTAAPYHRAHTPTYEFGGRDPYEGYGRVNPDVAIQAVTRDLTERDDTSEVVGLNRHEDRRAVAGYLDPDGPGTYTVDASFSHLAGGNRGMAKGDPHIDLYVYDAGNPTENGEPNIVSRAQGREGNPSLSFTASEGGTYLVVAKLLNVPGVVNGYDVQAAFDLSVGFDSRLVTAAGRTDDGSVFTGGQTNQVDIAVETTEPVQVRDVVPGSWTVQTQYGDVDHVHHDEDAGLKYVNLTGHGEGTDDLDATYFVEAPSSTGQYRFGPVEVSTDGENWSDVAGTSDTNRVVGTSTNF